MQLFSRWQNSAGERVRIALNLKGVPYEYIAVGSLPPGEYRRLNPQGLMPALRVDDKVIAQSTAILEYIEETHPLPALLPSEPILRAQARAFAQLIACDLHPLNNNRVRKYLADRLEVSEADLRTWYHHWTALALTALEAALAARPREWPFCFGNRPGWAELHLVPQLANARRFDCDLADYPILREVDARCRILDALRQARPEAQPDHPDATG